MTTKTKPATQGFRIVMRGKNAEGQYRRAVVTVQAPTEAAALGFVAENGEKLARQVKAKRGINVQCVNVLPPLHTVRA